ncbi:MAG: hypothetical protein GWO24_30190, partial [Akkermansiaceae bacterium]|nr:hypothetical protein [Akkermansiaceae bacterium]
MNLVLANSEGESVLIDWIESYGNSPWLLGLAMVFATLVSEDLTCISGGVLAAKGWIPFMGASVACSVGIWLGDMGLYGLGVLAGRSRRHW